MAEILVVDDDDRVRSLIEQILSRAGHATRGVCDGAEAIARIRAHPPALVITDIFMPEREGIETIRELRRTNPALPIIAVSGQDGFYLDAAMALGANAALEKPFTREALLELVDVCLSASDGFAAVAEG